MNKEIKLLIDQLEQNQGLKKEEYVRLLRDRDEEAAAYLYEKARKLQQEYYGKNIFIRGLIEFSNYCHNNCYYCGIRKGNEKVSRYRLTPEEILERCALGWELGFRTFVLQGGEDDAFDDETVCGIIRDIKAAYPESALTLSMGEKERASYQAFYDAGADRYLLRHETANESHYRKLHPPALTLEHRKQCLMQLKEIGFHTGTGFMVGSPWQTEEYLAEDLEFIRQLQPHMVGIGPFISHKDTPFRDMENGTSELTIYLIAILRLMLPHALIPATTALGTIAASGREQAILAGANVIMPNLSPQRVRKKYMLYDDKISTGSEAAETVADLKERVRAIGYEVCVTRGDPARKKEKEGEKRKINGNE